ncbi:amidase family protein [Corynebacterium kozikiae]|uniref:amidase family protein n=1 Tax=Corynebacterium kozikiae TaxID=2968469 RepID=UPI00211C53E7|nr:amidase [Corynebacterium sp. 76QC2CO]MCQ9343031.1 amidase [Corynebacterium sp. 76QC2CO]
MGLNEQQETAQEAAHASVEARIDQLARRIHAMPASEHGFAHFDAEAALRQAAEQARNQANTRGRLAGWLIPAKDLSHVAGMPTSFGSVHRVEWPEETDPFIAAFQRLGAIVPGKTLASELGLSAYTEPVGLPAPTNPRFPGATPGGSSGGAAVAVARGLVRAAHGSDGGGSIRVPAAAVGIVGYKPPHNTHQANPVAQGFLSATLADAATLANIRAPRRGVAVRVGVLMDPVHAQVTAAEHMLVGVDTAAARLAAAGHAVKAVPVPYGPEVFEAFHTLFAWRSRTVEGHGSPLVEWLRETGWKVSENQAQAAAQTFAQVKARLLAAWDVDVVLSPTLAFDPPKIGYFSSMPPEEDFYAQTRWTPWATMANMSGLGALNVPDANKVGLHLLNLRLTPAQLFAVAQVLEGS